MGKIEKMLKMLLTCTLFVTNVGMMNPIKATHQTEEIKNENEALKDDGSYYSTMDEEGNIEWHIIDLQKDEASYPAVMTLSSDASVVEFSKAYTTLEYVEADTNIEGYLSAFYSADAAYLGTKDGYVKFKLSGVVGWIKKQYVRVHPYSEDLNLSYYYISDGKFYHAISHDLSALQPASYIRVGNAPSYLKEGRKYYSYDGHYFYLDYETMIDDYLKGRFTNSVNPTKPYYNYYQFLSMRVPSYFNAEQIDGLIDKRILSDKSKLNNAGKLLKDAEQYGVNASLVLGIAANESGWGHSSISQNKNNLFGLNAVDSSPGISAMTFGSPKDCINYFSQKTMSLGYLLPIAWVYYGPHLGDKNSGMNVKYASDPFWGEKAAAQSYVLEDMYGVYPSNQKDILIDHSNPMIWIYRSATTSSKILYGNGNINDKPLGHFPFVVLDTIKNSEGTFYKIKTDGILTSTRSSLTSKENGLYSSYNYGYIKANGKQKFIDNMTMSLATPEFELNKTSITLNVKDTFLLKASYGNGELSFKSSNTAVASVSSSGKIVANAPGSCTITVKDGSQSKKCSVKVVKPTLTISKKTHTMYRFGTYRLLATTTGASTKVTWKSSNEKIATVSSNGTVTTLADGSVKITASANGLSASCEFTVLKHTPVSSISLNKTKMSLEEGKTKQLIATILPTNATYKDVTYQTSDASIAKVNSKGIVTGVSCGIATITAISSNKKKVECVVYVKPQLTLAKSSHTMYCCKYFQIKPTCSKADSKITYQSSDEKIAVVGSNGNVYAKKAGNVVIYVEANGVIKKCKITIKQHIPVKSVSFKKAAISLFEGAALNYPVKVEPSNATFDDVTYSSSNPSVVKVSSYGRILAKAPGTAYITAKSSNNKTDVLKVVVKRPTLTLSEQKVTMYRCSYYQLSAKCNKASAKITWETSNTDIATIDGNGRVYAKNDGLITVTAYADKAIAQCEFTIKKHIPVSQISLNTSKITLNGNTEYYLNALISPSNATYQNVTYVSSDPNVAVVDEQGVVHPVGNGVTMITAISSNKKEAICEVKIVK